ncbi:metal ABC transporter permease [Pelolinea submarina]|uniref:Zinc transport system permease protein n=1 Tax=Pelolinea submarina TaxID=913107 RepID=A0A347ZWW9_9CHLR|nr:metal ABC transporter permease [Pelolinea submarina]REG05543.1 zinc transport system permease protein [Pelolinea submarina]BBB49800.1 zinc transport system permease protein [Pelolinea submarina]
MLEIFQYGFMRNALAAGVLVSFACGIIGTYVVINRIVFLSGGIAHAAYGGIGLGYFLGINPIIGAIVFSLGASLGMGMVHRKTGERSDTIIGVMWAIGMAIGIIFLDMSPGYKADLMSYLFGSILAVPTSDLIIMLVLNVVILVLVALYYKELQAISFDETFAFVVNVPVNRLYLMLVCLVGLTVVMTMRIVGLIMVIALLTMPPAIAGLFVKDMKRMMGLSILLSILFTFVGLLLSYYLNLTSGATIILVAGVSYFISFMGKNQLRNRKKKTETNTVEA